MRKFTAAFLCLIFVLSSALIPANAELPGTPAISEGLQAAEILGVRSELDQLLQLQNLQRQTDESTRKMLELRGIILRRILLGVLEVRTACNTLEIESAFAYDVLSRSQRQLDSIDHFLTLLNFMDFGTLYTLEGAARIDKHFTASRIFTCVSAGVGSTLPAIEVLFNKTHMTRDISPPKFLLRVMNTGALDGHWLPEHVAHFLDTPDVGDTMTRREKMHALWQQRYQVAASERASLCSLTDGRPQSAEDLHKRVLVLWSLHTFVEAFDHELLALLELVKWFEPAPAREFGALALKEKIGATAADAANLLGIAPHVSELIYLNDHEIYDLRRCKLEVYVLERIIAGTLEVRIAINKIHEEINHAKNYALSQLERRRKDGLERNFEVNFIQRGALGANAGQQYFNRRIKTGNLLFVISGAVGTSLATLALIQAHGGKRKRDTPPNSLAAFFNLDSEHRFSPFITALLNSADPNSTTGKTKIEESFDILKNNKYVTMNMRDRKNLELVAAMPSEKHETIGLLRNRIALLHFVKTRIEVFDYELLQLLRSTEPSAQHSFAGAETSASIISLRPSAAEYATLLGVQAQVANLFKLKNSVNHDDVRLIENQLFLTRRIFSAQLEARVTGSTTHEEIAHETAALERMTRARNLGIALTNNANFFQIGILEIIINGPLGLSKPKYFVYGDRLTVISGLTAIGLAAASFLQQRGGFRKTKAEPNLLGPCFGLNSEVSNKFSPLLLKYLSVPQAEAPNQVTRKQELINFWKRSGLLDLDVTKGSVQQKLSATGDQHHWWNESMRLIRNRISMLGDLRAMVDLMDVGLADLLRSLD